MAFVRWVLQFVICCLSICHEMLPSSSCPWAVMILLASPSCPEHDIEGVCEVTRMVLGTHLVDYHILPNIPVQESLLINLLVTVFPIPIITPYLCSYWRVFPKVDRTTGMIQGLSTSFDYHVCSLKETHIQGMVLKYFFWKRCSKSNKFEHLYSRLILSNTIATSSIWLLSFGISESKLRWCKHISEFLLKSMPIAIFLCPGICWRDCLTCMRAWWDSGLHWIAGTIKNNSGNIKCLKSFM